MEKSLKQELDELASKDSNVNFGRVICAAFVIAGIIIVENFHKYKFIGFILIALSWFYQAATIDNIMQDKMYLIKYIVNQDSNISDYIIEINELRHSKK